MSKVEDLFGKVFDKLYRMDQPIQEDYNALQEHNPEANSKLLIYMNVVLTGTTTEHNIIKDIQSALFEIENLLENDDDERARFIVTGLEKKLKDFHIKIKSLFDVTIRFVATVFRIKINNKMNFYSRLKEELPVDNQITDFLENIKYNIDNYDKGMRNKIIHEGTFEDNEIRDAHLDGVLMGFRKKHKFKKSFAEEINELVRKKLDSLEQVCIEVLEKLSNVIDLLEEEYYRNDKQLS